MSKKNNKANTMTNLNIQQKAMLYIYGDQQQEVNQKKLVQSKSAKEFIPFAQERDQLGRLVKNSFYQSPSNEKSVYNDFSSSKQSQRPKKYHQGTKVESNSIRKVIHSEVINKSIFSKLYKGIDRRRDKQESVIGQRFKLDKTKTSQPQSSFFKKVQSSIKDHSILSISQKNASIKEVEEDSIEEKMFSDDSQQQQKVVKSLRQINSTKNSNKKSFHLIPSIMDEIQHIKEEEKKNQSQKKPGFMQILKNNIDNNQQFSTPRSQPSPTRKQSSIIGESPEKNNQKKMNTVQSSQQIITNKQIQQIRQYSQPTVIIDQTIDQNNTFDMQNNTPMRTKKEKIEFIKQFLPQPDISQILNKQRCKLIKKSQATLPSIGMYNSDYIKDKYIFKRSPATKIQPVKQKTFMQQKHQSMEELPPIFKNFDKSEQQSLAKMFERGQKLKRKVQSYEKPIIIEEKKYNNSILPTHIDNQQSRQNLEDLRKMVQNKSYNVQLRDDINEHPLIMQKFGQAEKSHEIIQGLIKKKPKKYI